MSSMRIDEGLALVGGYRRWHIAVFFMLSFSSFLPSCLQSLAFVFIAGTPPHHCTSPEGQYDVKESIPMASTQTYPNETYSTQYLECEIFVNSSIDNMTVPCTNGWTYHPTSDQERTIVMEWDLVCSKDFLADLSQMVMEIGGLLAHLVGSALADVFGRQKIHISFNLLIVLAGIVAALSPNYTVFIIARCVSGFVIMVGVFSGFVLLMELYDSKKKVVVGFGCEFMWVSSYLCLPLMSYFIRNWRHLLLTNSLLHLIWIYYFWFLPESPLWLVAQGRYNEANGVLRFMARMNGLNLNQELQITEDDDGEITEFVGSELNDKSENKKAEGITKGAAYSWTELFTNSLLLKHLIISSWFWFVNNLIYYGLVLNTPGLGGNTYLNYSIGGAMEFLGYSVTLLVSQRYGRRYPAIIFHLGAGLSLGVLPLVPRDNLRPLAITLAMIGKFFISASYSLIVIYITELFPTSIRSRSLGISNVPGRVGSILAPMLIYAARRFSWLPNLVFCVMAISAGLVAILLPETSDKPLPNTLQDVYHLYGPGKQNNKSLKQPKYEPEPSFPENGVI